MKTTEIKWGDPSRQLMEYRKLAEMVIEADKWPRPLSDKGAEAWIRECAEQARKALGIRKHALSGSAGCILDPAHDGPCYVLAG